MAIVTNFDADACVRFRDFGKGERIKRDGRLSVRVGIFSQVALISVVVVLMS
jgi:hypothetical protein